MRWNRFGVFQFCGKAAKWGYLKFKLRYKSTVELCKPKDFCNMLDNVWFRPVFKELMLQHGITNPKKTGVNLKE
jgi:hypothetical protein